MRLIIGIFLLLSMCLLCFRPKSYYFTKKGVSLAQPVWCPTNVESCDAYMLEKAIRMIRRYAKDHSESKSQHVFNSQFALNRLGLTEKKHEGDKQYYDELIRVFIRTFEQLKPKMQLARREGLQLDHYL